MRRSQTTGQILGSHSTADERTPLITPARPSGAEALAHSYPDPALPTPSGRDSLQRAISTAGYPAKKDHEAIDANHLDVRFKRWTEAIAQRMKSKAKGKRKAEEDSPPRLVLSVFEKISPQDAGSTQDEFEKDGQMSQEEFDSQVEAVRAAISQNVLPKMITTGSSGSYFALVKDAETGVPRTVGVFKPKDEEPYGNLNPKRVFLRKYFWWAMGRPCLITNFSYLSEAGASFLDGRLNLHMVPRTGLVSMASPSFFYEQSDRKKWEKGDKDLPAKIGSFQTFLHGYTNASDFLRAHPWPSRPRSLMERDFAAERRSHGRSRGKTRGTLRTCGAMLQNLLLCRAGTDDDEPPETAEEAEEAVFDPHTAEEVEAEQDFVWTSELMISFRLELEKLVVLDYLMRNTDRGLDNFMIKCLETSLGTKQMRIGAIDNSLSFPHQHPNGIRDYPYGWLWLPVDLIGAPFSKETRDHFVPILSDPVWWQATIKGLRKLFEQDEHFGAKKFERQMALLKGQGWNLVQSLLTPSDGPLELCARPKRLVHSTVVEKSEAEVATIRAKWAASRAAAAAAAAASRSEVSASTDKAPAPALIPVKAKRTASGQTQEQRSPTGVGSPSDWGTFPTSLPCSPPSVRTLAMADLYEAREAEEEEDHEHGHDHEPMEDDGGIPNGHGHGDGQGQRHRRFASLQGVGYKYNASEALGIDVLEQIDKAAKRNRRARGRGRGRGQAQKGSSATTGAGDGDGHARESSNQSAYAHYRQVEEDGNGDEDGEGEDGYEQGHTRGVFSDSETTPTLASQSKRRLVRRRTTKTPQAQGPANKRGLLADADARAQSTNANANANANASASASATATTGSVQAAFEPTPESPVVPDAEAEAASCDREQGRERDDTTSADASTRPTLTTNRSDAEEHLRSFQGPLPRHGRGSGLGRARAQSGWLLSSGRYDSDGAGAEAGAGAEQARVVKVKVIVERLETDTSRAWLTWY